nr:putative reverse transcriptase domain-containing protein [Tanacetum cinerariifolium]
MPQVECHPASQRGSLLGSGLSQISTVEYEALIAGLRIAVQMEVRNVHVRVDSKLVANQVLGTYVTKEENMIKYLKKTKSLISGFANFSISQVPRSKNKKADALSKIASTRLSTFIIGLPCKWVATPTATDSASSLNKCLSDESLVIPWDELCIDDKLHFVEEPIEIMDHEIMQLKRSHIPTIKVRWNSKRGPEFT